MPILADLIKMNPLKTVIRKTRIILYLMNSEKRKKVLPRKRALKDLPEKKKTIILVNLKSSLVLSRLILSMKILLPKIKHLKLKKRRLKKNKQKQRKILRMKYIQNLTLFMKKIPMILKT